MLDLPVQHHYFGSGHGKGPADACIGRVKRQVDDAVRTDRADITDSVSMAYYCMTQLSVYEILETDQCRHFTRSFKYIANIPRDIPLKAEPVKGTMSFHAIKNNGTTGEIIVQLNSCFCKFCRLIVVFGKI